jgi:hypothetical protein
MIHACGAVLMMALFLGHIYMGTIGVRGAWTGHEDRLGRRGLGRSTTSSGTTTSRPARSRPLSAPGRHPAAWAPASSKAPPSHLRRSNLMTMHPCWLADPACLRLLAGRRALGQAAAPSDEAKAKAAEAAAKTAHAGKVDNFKLCKSMDRWRPATGRPRRPARPKPP